jgi:hypothetical protein
VGGETQGMAHLGLTTASVAVARQFYRESFRRSGYRQNSQESQAGARILERHSCCTGDSGVVTRRNLCGTFLTQDEPYGSVLLGPSPSQPIFGIPQQPCFC